ncbi:MFS transporter [Saccharospirillum salsuginis]|uniref:MFS transporter n=1 Tax=Saccharospirillum salsuginis TaxID=418750 RepID=A0A918KQT7_9GAMM|nr:MFS transporter [Saccharospirillum salsuginis]GGX69983.1 MFS transporter [Saccharospirillum salsuginis]
MAFNALEKKALTGLSLLYASRMLGLFMVLPVLTLYGQDLDGATTQLLGLALGIYGITQAVLQLPLGMLSDRVGRKPVILAGLGVFLAGSVLAALADHVLWLVVGRALQGAGAIASVVLALLADYTRESERTKAMAIVGAIIGASFVLAVIVGPILADAFDLSGVFWSTALLALLGMAVLAWLPHPPQARVHEERQLHLRQLGAVLGDRRLSPLSLGIFSLHLTMTALFVGLPVVLTRQGIGGDQLGWVYAPVMVLSFVAMVPMIMVAERRKAHVPVLRWAAVLLALAVLGLGFSESAALSIGLIWLFFVGFNFMEATLPSLISRRAPVTARGTAMGVFSTSQFLGAACGGLVGGWAFSTFDMTGIAAISLAVILLWLVIVWWAERRDEKWAY